MTEILTQEKTLTLSASDDKLQTIQQLNYTSRMQAEAIISKKPASHDSFMKESRSMSPIRKLNLCSDNSQETPETGLSGNTQPEHSSNKGLNKS